MSIGLRQLKCLAVGVCVVSMGCGSSKNSNATSDAGEFWPSAYSSTGAPPSAQAAYHIATPENSACMACHSASSSQSSFKIAFGGIVYKSDAVTPAANVQIGVSDGSNKYFVYSASNGYFWAAGSDNIKWASADIRLRTAKGESVKASSDGRSADCSFCHVGADLLIAP
jgi:hypothetical protein